MLNYILIMISPVAVEFLMILFGKRIVIDDKVMRKAYAIIIGAGVVGCAVAQQLARYDGKLLVIDRMEDELGYPCAVVATGGLAVLIAEESRAIDTLDGLLTLKGLRLIYERNRTEGEKK